jgi:RNA methyltransferase, TrmH family
MTCASEVISSRDNPLIKELRKLLQDGSSYRKTGRVWIEGEHLCISAALKGCKAQMLLVSDQKLNLPGMIPHEFAIKKVVIADALMRELSSLESPAGMGAVMQLPAQPQIDLKAATVILDRLQDPGNVGSILRSAAAFGYKQIVALKGTVALWSPKVLRAGMGAHFSLRLIEGASVDDLSQLAHPLAATSSHGGIDLHTITAQTIHSLLKSEHSAQYFPGLEAKNAQKTALSELQFSLNWVLGHEGQGVQDALMQRAQLKVRIAQPGGEESLNVAAAAAIVLHASSVMRV